jgi:hypothetical protein
MSILTQAQLLTEISANISDPLQRQNTAAKVREVCNDITDTFFSIRTSLTITNDVTTDASMFPVWVTANSGDLPLKVASSKLSFNPAKGELSINGDKFILTDSGNSPRFIIGDNIGSTTAYGSLSWDSNNLWVYLGVGNSQYLVLHPGGLVEVNNNFSVQGTINGLNIGLGANSLSTNVAIGNSVLSLNSTGNSNTGVGYLSLVHNTTGSNSVGIGYAALTSNTTGGSNVGIGYQALFSNTIGSDNISIGRQSLNSNIAGSGAIAIGTDAMQYANSTSTLFTNTNIAIGLQALRGSVTAASNTGLNNIAIGYQSLFSITSGDSNTVIGYNSAIATTTGRANTIIGASVTTTSGLSNNIILADGDGVIRLQFDNTGVLNLVGPEVTTSVATASTNKIAIKIGGVQYYLLVTT